MVYMGTRDAIETPSAALEALPKPYNFASQTMLQVKLLAMRFCQKDSVNILCLKFKFNETSLDLRLCGYRRCFDSARIIKDLFGSN